MIALTGACSSKRGVWAARKWEEGLQYVVASHSFILVLGIECFLKKYTNNNDNHRNKDLLFLQQLSPQHKTQNTKHNHIVDLLTTQRTVTINLPRRIQLCNGKNSMQGWYFFGGVTILSFSRHRRTVISAIENWAIVIDYRASIFLSLAVWQSHF